MSEFIRPIDEYKREYDISRIALQDLSTYLQTMRGLSKTDADSYVLSQMKPTGAFPLKNPIVTYLERGKNGDREKKETDLLSYLKEIEERKLILAPNMTAYMTGDTKKSIFADYIQLNLGLRKADKKKMFAAEMRGDFVQEAYWKTMQQSRKIKNNSLSGMHASPSTIGYNKSAHSSLTSLCRCATSYANSSNEKFIGGYRHYYAPGVVNNHILTAIRTTDIEKMSAFIDRHNLHYPTADEVIKCIRRSTINYWDDPNQFAYFQELVEKLHPAVRAGFLYVGDLYHFDLYNSDFVRGFLDSLTYMDDQTMVEDPESVIKSLDDNYKACASLMSEKVIKGISLDDAKKDRPDAYRTVAATALHMKETMAKYADFTDQILTQRYLPHSVAAFPSAARFSVPTSDTDSTIFTVEHWAMKYGDYDYGPKSMSTQYAIVFLISGMIQNTLIMYSANLGVVKEHLLLLEMKNEFIFPVYVLTAIAKHYYALITAGEGNVYADEGIKLERKGVQLRSSNAPIHINDKVVELIKYLMGEIMNGRMLRTRNILDFVSKIEHEIRENLLSGGHEYLNTLNIKGAESYTQGEDAVNYKSYTFWNTHFGQKYGMAPEPPYRALKVTVSLANKTAIKKWLDSIDDEITKHSLTEWVESSNVSSVKLFRLPIPNLQATGYPKEIIDIIDVRAIIREVMKPFYLILESLGLYISNERTTRLLMEEHVYLKELSEYEGLDVVRLDADTYRVTDQEGGVRYMDRAEVELLAA